VTRKRVGVKGENARTGTKKRTQVSKKTKTPEVVTKTGAQSAWNRYTPTPHMKSILVYAGEHTAFCIREFNTMEGLARFVASSQLRLEEYAVVTGMVKRCDPRYKPDTAYRAPWDDGSEPESASTTEEMCTTSQPVTLEDVRQLLGG
jgi:hypothetical protein